MGFAMGFDFFGILFAIMFVAVAAVIIATAVKSLSQWHTNNNSPRLTVPASVVAKRAQVGSSVHHNAATHTSSTHYNTRYFATFQFESGDRLELPVAATEYGLLVEGDHGLLSFQGTRYLGFQRQ